MWNSVSSNWYLQQPTNLNWVLLSTCLKLQLRQYFRCISSSYINGYFFKAITFQLSDIKPSTNVHSNILWFLTNIKIQSNKSSTVKPHFNEGRLANKLDPKKFPAPSTTGYTDREKWVSMFHPNFFLSHWRSRHQLYFSFFYIQWETLIAHICLNSVSYSNAYTCIWSFSFS